MSQLPADRGASLPPRSTSLTILLSLTTLGSLLGVVTYGDRIVPGDVAVLEAIQRVNLPGVASIVKASNTIFNTGGALVMGVLFVALALFMHRSQFVLQLVVVIVLRTGGQLLKPLFDSPRPGIEYQPDPSVVSHTLGYPSGHAYTATVIMSMLVLFVWSFDVSRWARWLAVAIAVAITAIATFSRVWVGAHWPSDTLGGVLFGIATIGLMQLIVGAIAAGRAAPNRRMGS